MRLNLCAGLTTGLLLLAGGALAAAPNPQRMGKGVFIYDFDAARLFMKQNDNLDVLPTVAEAVKRLATVDKAEWVCVKALDRTTTTPLATPQMDPSYGLVEASNAQDTQADPFHLIGYQVLRPPTTDVTMQEQAEAARALMGVGYVTPHPLKGIVIMPSTDFFEADDDLEGALSEQYLTRLGNVPNDKLIAYSPELDLSTSRTWTHGNFMATTSPVSLIMPRAFWGKGNLLDIPNHFFYFKSVMYNRWKNHETGHGPDPQDHKANVRWNLRKNLPLCPIGQAEAREEYPVSGIPFFVEELAESKNRRNRPADPKIPKYNVSGVGFWLYEEFNSMDAAEFRELAPEFPRNHP